MQIVTKQKEKFKNVQSLASVFVLQASSSAKNALIARRYYK